jgi:hypothetical protein
MRCVVPGIVRGCDVTRPRRATTAPVFAQVGSSFAGDESTLMGDSPVVADSEPFHARQFPQCRPYGFSIVTRNVRLRTGLYALGFSIGCRTRSRSTRPEGAFLRRSASSGRVSLPRHLVSEALPGV